MLRQKGKPKSFCAPVLLLLRSLYVCNNNDDMEPVTGSGEPCLLAQGAVLINIAMCATIITIGGGFVGASDHAAWIYNA